MLDGMLDSSWVFDRRLSLDVRRALQWALAAGPDWDHSESLIGSLRVLREHFCSGEILRFV